MIRSLLWMFAFILALQHDLHHQVAAAKAITCNPSDLKAKGFYALQKKNDYMELTIYDTHMEPKEGIWKLRLGKAENQEYRLFFRSEYKLLIVSCYLEQEDDNKRVCGYYQHQLKTDFDQKKQAEAVDFLNLGWWYKPFFFANFTGENYVDMSKIYFEETPGGGKIHLNKRYYYDLAMEKGRNRTEARGEHGTDNTYHCFEAGYHCAYDLRLRRTVEVKENASAPLYYYGAHKFSVDQDHFMHDNLLGSTCYGTTKEYELILPYLSPEVSEVSSSLFIKDFDDKVSALSKECPRDGLLKEIEEELGPRNMSEEFYYQDDGSPRGPSGDGNIGMIDDRCKDNSLYLYIFIVSAVFAAIITCLLIALIVLIMIAKKKMIKQGHRLPKKPWETQATEDNATLLDQTVGVTEATTVGGETSAYTTVAQ